MTRAPAPTSAEIEQIGRALAKYWPGAAKSLQLYTSGAVPWDSALRPVRELLRAAIADVNRGHKVPRGIRHDLNTFAATYGTDTRSPVGIEPRDIKKTYRWTETEYRTILAAAEKAGMTEAQFVTSAAYKAARAQQGEGPQ